MMLLLIHAGATLYMTGLIWFVQVVHYPLMARVGEGGFAEYEKHHQRLTMWVVGPPMLVELATAIWLLIAPTAGVDLWMTNAGLAMVVLLWLSTAFMQVPQHRKLEGGFDPAAHRLLVKSNWLRTVLWSLRGGLVIWMVGG